MSKISHNGVQRATAETKPNKSRKFYRLLFDNIPYPALVYDLETLRFLAVNQEAVRSYGYSKEEFLELTLRDLQSPENVSILPENADQIYTNEASATRQEKHRKKDGSVIDVETASQPIVFDNRRECLALAIDVTARRRVENQLRHDALHDALTGLPNRALFLEHLRRAVDRRERKLFAVLFLDFDHFKLVNDSLGHMAGDDLLRFIAQRLTESLRPGDIVARLGGDEFTMLIEDLGESRNAKQIVERIQNKLKAPFELCGNEVFISASIGIIVSDEKYSDPETMLRDADTAMYRFKADGKVQY